MKVKLFLINRIRVDGVCDVEGGHTMPKVHILSFLLFGQKGTFAAVWVGKIKRKDKKRVGKLVS